MFSRAILAIVRSTSDLPSTVRIQENLSFRTICAFATQCDQNPSSTYPVSNSSVENARVSSKAKESGNNPSLIVRRRARIKEDQKATASSSSLSLEETKDSELGVEDADGEERTSGRRFKSKEFSSRTVRNSSLEMQDIFVDSQNVRASESLVAARELSEKATVLSKGHDYANPLLLVRRRTKLKKDQKYRVSPQPDTKDSESEPEPKTETIGERGYNINGILFTECNDGENLYTDVTEASRVSVVSETVNGSMESRGDARENIIVPERLVLKVEILEEAGVDPSDLAILLKKRALVSVSFEKLKSVINLLKSFFGTGEMACKVLAQNSGILSRPLEHLEFKLKCLEEFELEGETCQRIGTAKHTILTMAGESLHQKLSYLQSIGLSSSSINVLLSRFPQVLRLTVSASIEPTLVYLESKGMGRDEINTLILKHPSLLAMSVCNNLDKKFELLGQLGLSNEECHKAIGFLTLPSCDRARAVLETLKSYGISELDITEMVRKNPDIFSRSPENISKKIDWLINEGNRDIKEIIHYPTCLCFHLDNRIVPRINALKETKFRSCPLSTVLSMPDDSFRAQFHLPDFPSSKKSRQPRRQ